MQGKSSPSSGSSGEKLPKDALAGGKHQPGTCTSLCLQPAAPKKAVHSLTTQGMTASVGMATWDAAAGMAGQEFAIEITEKCLIDLKNTNRMHSPSLTHSLHLVLPS